MGQLLVRNMDDEVVDWLKARAAANGRSVEAEHHQMLRRERADRFRGTRGGDARAAWRLFLPAFGGGHPRDAR